MLKFKKAQLAWVAINRDDFSSLVEQGENKQFKLKAGVDKGYQLYYAASLATVFMRFGMKDKLIGQNKALRQAIALAMNADGFVNLMFNGRGYVSDSVVPLEIAGSSQDTHSVWYRQNLELAKKKMVEAGFPEGKGLPPIMVEYRTSSKEQRQLYEYMRNELAKIGIKLEGNFQTFSSFLKKTDAGNYQIADTGWNADYPDAENFYSLFYGKNKSPGPNTGSFENARYDELYENSRHMKSGPERNQLFTEMDAIIKEEVPTILLMNQIVMGLLQANVRNFKRSMMDEFPYKYFDLVE